MSYHRSKRPQGVGAIAAATPAPRGVPAAELGLRAGRPYSTLRQGLGRIREERPMDPETGGSGPIMTYPRPRQPVVVQIPPPAPTPSPPPPPPPAPAPPPVTPPPPPPVPTTDPSCVFPMGWVNGQCVLVGGIVPPSAPGPSPLPKPTPIPPLPTPRPPTEPYPGPVVCIRAPCPGSELPPIEVDEIEILPTPSTPAPAPKPSLLPYLLIGGGVAVGLHLILKKR